jgi:hypothetical protein
MHQGVDAALGDIRVAVEIHGAVEAGPSGAALPTTVRQIVIQEREPGDVRIALLVPRRVEQPGRFDQAPIVILRRLIACNCAVAAPDVDVQPRFFNVVAR